MPDTSPSRSHRHASRSRPSGDPSTTPTSVPASSAGTAPPAPSASGPTPGAGAVSSPASPTTDITAGPGGVMTDEVGVVTGDLTLRTDYADGRAVVHVQYKDADEWYVVTGANAPVTDPADTAAVHTVAVGILHRPEG